MKKLLKLTTFFAPIVAMGCVGITQLDAAERDMFVTQNEDQIQCMATTLYFEARSESDLGQKAVAAVVMNRTESKKYPSSVCGVVTQANKNADGSLKRHKCAFSYYCDGKSDVARDKSQFERSRKIAVEAMLTHSDETDITEGSVMYHATYVSPYWKNAYARTAQVDSHIFYKEK